MQVYLVGNMSLPRAGIHLASNLDLIHIPTLVTYLTFCVIVMDAFYTWLDDL